MSTDEYLEECLQPQAGKSAAVAEQNATRSAIRSLFRERSCIALPHPTLGTSLPPSALKALPALASLAEGFRKGVESLKGRISDGARPKVVHGAALTGPMLLALADAYVAAINDGALPTISTAWSNVVHLECRRAATEAQAVYTDGVAALTQPNRPPLDEAQWLIEHARLHAEALECYRQGAVGAGESGGGASSEHEAELRGGLAREKARVEELLAARSQALCSTVSAELAAELTSALGGTGGDVAAAVCADVSKFSGAVARLISAYEARAHGLGKAAGRVALMQRVIEGVHAALSALAGQLATARREASERAAAADRRSEALMRERDGAREDAQASKHELVNATARVRALEQEATARSATVAKADAERDASRQQAARAAEEVRRLGDALQAVQASLREAEARCTQQRTDGAQHSTRATQAEGRLASSEAQLAEATASLAARTREAISRDGEISRLGAELAQDRAEIVRLREELEMAQVAADANARAAVNARAAQADANARAAQAAEAEAVGAAEDRDPAPPADAPKRQRVGSRAASRPASAHAQLSPEAAQPPPPGMDAEAAMEPDGPAEGAEEEDDEELKPAPRRRSSVDPKDMSIPVLQAKLKKLMGNPNAKLPRKKGAKADARHATQTRDTHHATDATRHTPRAMQPQKAGAR